MDKIFVNRLTCDPHFDRIQSGKIETGFLINNLYSVKVCAVVENKKCVSISLTSDWFEYKKFENLEKYLIEYINSYLNFEYHTSEFDQKLKIELSKLFDEL